MMVFMTVIMAIIVMIIMTYYEEVLGWDVG
jgi:hypothetical protein